MFCTKCGTQIPDDSRFCHRCGAAVNPMSHNDMIDNGNYITPENAPDPIEQSAKIPQQPTTTDDGIFGLLGFILSFFVPIVGFILSVIGLNKKKNAGFATAGLIISIITVILTIVVIVLIVENDTSSTPPVWYL